MPRVTRLDPSGREGDHYRLELDDDRQATLSARTVERHDLRPGQELSEATARDLLTEAGRREAMDRALGYLSHRPRSRRELERYLRRKGFEDRALEPVIARCEELGYVDDRAFAEAFVRDRIRLRPRGVFRLESELREKGIDPEDAQEAIRSAFRETGVTERELLRRVARKQWKRLRGKDPRTARRRLVGALRRRGFPAAEIYRIVEEMTGDRR